VEWLLVKEADKRRKKNLLEKVGSAYKGKGKWVGITLSQRSGKREGKPY
jgi:hypothetical protein